MKCSICGSQKFKNYRGRINARCSKCFSLERHREAWNVIRTLNLQDVLYVGPEPCLAKKIRSRCNRFVSADIAPKYKATVKCDLRNTQFKDKEFNTVICLHVLEHIIQCDEAITELARIATTAIISVPLSATVCFRDHTATTKYAKTIAHGQQNHEWQFGKLDFHELLLSNGFSQYQLIKDIYICQ